MALSLSGTGTVNSSVGVGTATFPYLSNNDGAVSIRTKIREALAFQIKNTIRIDNGFFLDIGEVNVNGPINNAQRKAFPSVDILFVQERYTNSFQGGNSLGGYNKFATVFIIGNLFEDDCKFNQGDMVLLRENFVADIEKLMGINFFIPDNLGNRTAFNSILTSNRVFGIEATKPRGGVEMELEISYRIELADPTQDF